jgi:starch synthase (maltosyl-transferring)
VSSPKVRVVIENITPCIDCGRFPIKRTSGEPVVVEADVFTDGHDQVAAILMYRHDSVTDWHKVPMQPIGNDRWRAEFTVQQLGSYQYSVCAWVDHLDSWRRAIRKKYEARQDIHVDLKSGALIAESLAERAHGTDAQRLRDWAAAIIDTRRDMEARMALIQSESIRELQLRYPDPDIVLHWDTPLEVAVDRERARYSTWYEMFPRSAATAPGKHGTFADVQKLLPYVASMGFDVLYMPPIHPIGTTERKGPNNNPKSSPGDPGSPWAIGGSEGGHKSIHPELGTLEDFKQLIAKAGELGIEIAMDIAFQTTPDHPYVREHREWFLERPDGTIQYAENPPKKYQDIYPFHFESNAGEALATELRTVIEYWISHGIRIFRVDNPHTKPFPFWEGLIREIRRLRPDVIFLAEAFTRPKVMYRLAKLGFTQSYNYFPWRNTKQELTEYFTELSRPPVSDFFRASLWPNTPDILPEYLQYGGRPGFMIRLVLAATLGASYGIYGPAFELMEGRAVAAGKEEYLDSEKYQIRQWSRDDPASLREFIALVNRIRRDNAPLQSDRGLKFHATDNDNLVAFSKTRDSGDSILVAVNVDPHHVQAGWLQLDLRTLGLPESGTYQVHDLLSGARFLWQGARNFVSLDPARTPAHIFRIRTRVRSERDFDYFL